MEKKKVIRPRVFKGTRDFLPEVMIQRERIIAALKKIFTRYGFQPMETPSIEYLEILTGKYGEDGDKLIYPLAYKGGKELALRYDLTVPLSRVIAMNRQIQMPFKRFQIQPVWRADQPQLRQGRYREFYQCDADTVGTSSILADTEIISLTYDILKELGFKNFIIRINSRKILTGIMDMAELPNKMEDSICRSLDKLEKIGMSGVRDELGIKGLSSESINALMSILDVKGAPSEIISHLSKHPRASSLVEEALKELEELFTHINSFGIPADAYRWDLHLARGLDYYTGPIFESVLTDQHHIGSLTGGGRFDRLVGTFLGADIPAVGTTIGLDRIFAAMGQLNMLEENKSGVELMVCRFGKAETENNIKVAQDLRNEGFSVELYPEPDKLKKQFGFADKRGIPIVIVQGPDEVSQNIVTVKNLKSGVQETLSRNELTVYLKKNLQISSNED